MTTDKIITNLDLTIDNNEISQVTEFIYLGHQLSSKNDGFVAVQHRTGLGWATLSKNKAVLTSKRISYHLTSKIFNTYVIPFVLYGVESIQKFAVFQNHMVRFMTNKRLCHRRRNRPQDFAIKKEVPFSFLESAPFFLRKKCP